MFATLNIMIDDDICLGEGMKIKCFDATELPIQEWQDGCGSSTEIFCWPVASDFSLRASLEHITHTSFLKHNIEGERLSISLNKDPISLIDQHQCQHILNDIGDSYQSASCDSIKLELQASPARFLNLEFNTERWSAQSCVITQKQRLPIGQAGVVYILAGEWSISGANCKILNANQGGWWLPDIGEGIVSPNTASSILIWVAVTPC